MIVYPFTFSTRSSSRHQLRHDELRRDGERGFERHSDVQCVWPPEAGDQVEEGGRTGFRRVGEEGHQEKRFRE